MGTTGTDQYEEARQFRRARDERARESFVRDASEAYADVRESANWQTARIPTNEGGVYVDIPNAEDLVREWRLIAERYRNARSFTSDPF